MSQSRSQAPRQISSREWRFVWSAIAVVLAVTSLPYLYGYLSSPSDKQFMGLMLDVPDHGQYLSWWRGFQNSLFIRNKLTPEPNEPLFFNLLWWTLAQISRWTGAGYAPLYQAFRWIAGGSFLWATYRLIACLLPEACQRRTAFLLIAASSGFGWVLVVLKYTLMRGELLFPLDVYVAEGNSFLCILGYPHFAFAAAFISLTFETIWRGWQTGRTRYMVIAGVLALLLGWQHAYDLLIIYGVMGVFALLVWWKKRAFPWRLFWGGCVVFVLSCSGAFYSVALTTLDPLWEEVLAQFANAGVYTPPPLRLFVLFGLPLMLAVIMWIRLVWKKQWSETNLFILGWFLVGALLNYIPTDFQIHMLNSWQVPIMLLAAKGIHEWIAPAVSRWRNTARNAPLITEERIRHWLVVVSVLAVLPTNVYLWSWRFVDLARHDYPDYLHQDEVMALDWLHEHTPADAIVLSSLTVGQYVPALSGNTAFLAHWAQTVDFYEKQTQVEQFFDSLTPDESRAEIVRAFGIDYVLHGPAERELGDYDPETTPWLRPVFSAPKVSVYAVQADQQ